MTETAISQDLIQSIADYQIGVESLEGIYSVLLGHLFTNHEVPMALEKKRQQLNSILEITNSYSKSNIEALCKEFSIQEEDLESSRKKIQREYKIYYILETKNYTLEESIIKGFKDWDLNLNYLHSDIQMLLSKIPRKADNERAIFASIYQSHFFLKDTVKNIFSLWFDLSVHDPEG